MNYIQVLEKVDLQCTLNGDPHRVTRPSSGFKTWSGQGKCWTHLAAHSGELLSSSLIGTYLSGIYIVLEALKELRTKLIAAYSTRPGKGRIARYTSLLIAGGYLLPYSYEASYLLLPTIFTIWDSEMWPPGEKSTNRIRKLELSESSFSNRCVSGNFRTG